MVYRWQVTAAKDNSLPQAPDIEPGIEARIASIWITEKAVNILLTGRPQKIEPVRFPLALEKFSIHFKPYLRPARPKFAKPYISVSSVAGRGKLSVLQVSRLRDVFGDIKAIWRKARPAKV